VKALATGGKAMAANDFVHRHEANIVPVSGILGSRITETHKKKHARLL
jgi:hypothetical protein